MSRSPTGSYPPHAIARDAPNSAVPVPAAEQTLGPYRLCLELASGGMASVYLARIEGGATLNRFVALKRVHPHLASDPSFIEMFLDEARIASLIQHPNVCSVVDFDCVGGEYYLAMEFLVGEPLSSVMRAMMHRPHDATRVPSRAALVARIVADACEGLHAAHELRDPSGQPLAVVHRDVSPENLFLTYSGAVKVVDFGVARAAHQRHLTVPGMIKGKLAYMSPEVLRGVPPDRRADVWGAGVVLWELLTGTRLFHRATDVETLATISDFHVPAPSSVALDVPSDFDEIVQKALAADPDARYPTARDLAKDLTLALARRGEGVGLAELSEWMHELFPSGAACKRQLLEIAASMRSDTGHTGLVAAMRQIEDARPTTIRPPPASLLEDAHPTALHPPSLSACCEVPVPAKAIDSTAPEPPPHRAFITRAWVPSWLRSAAVSGLVLALFVTPLILAVVRPERVFGLNASAPSAPPRPEPVRAPPHVPVEPPPTPFATESPRLPIGPGSYAIEVEPSPDDDPTAIVLRLHRMTPQTARDDRR